MTAPVPAVSAEGRRLVDEAVRAPFSHEPGPSERALLGHIGELEARIETAEMIAGGELTEREWKREAENDRLTKALAAAEARAERAERERDVLRGAIITAFAAISEARGFEALCSKGDGLAHLLTAAQGALAAQIGSPARDDLAQTYGHSTDPAADDDPEEPDFDGPTPALLRGAELLKTLLAQKEEAPLLRVRAALRSLPSSRRDLDRMGEAIRALPGSPVAGRAIGDGR